jgi:hypothetical protein
LFFQALPEMPLFTISGTFEDAVESFCWHFSENATKSLCRHFSKKCRPNFLPALLEDPSNYFFRLLTLVPLIILLGIF